MGKVFRRALPICAAVAVIGAAFAASGANAIYKKCHLFPTLTIVHGSSGAGSVDYRLRIGNPEAWSCRIGRHPALQLISDTDDFLPTNRVKVGAQGTVVIPANGAVSARLRFSQDIPGPGEPTHGACEPKAVKIRVHTAWGYRTGRIQPPTSVCDHGRIEESALS